jgi:hypothetical protein
MRFTAASAKNGHLHLKFLHNFLRGILTHLCDNGIINTQPPKKDPFVGILVMLMYV